MMVMLILTKFYFIQGVISVVTKIFFTVQRLAIVIKNSWRKWFGSRDSHAVWKGKYTTKLFIVVTNNNGPTYRDPLGEHFKTDRTVANLAIIHFLAGTSWKGFENLRLPTGRLWGRCELLWILFKGLLPNITPVYMYVGQKLILTVFLSFPFRARTRITVENYFICYSVRIYNLECKLEPGRGGFFINIFKQYLPIVRRIKITRWCQVLCIKSSFFRKQTNDMVVAAVALLNSHIQDFDPVKVSCMELNHL